MNTKSGSNVLVRLASTASRAVARTDGLLMAYQFPKPFSRSRLARIGHRVMLAGATGDAAGLASALVGSSHHLSGLTTGSIVVAGASTVIALAGGLVMNVGLFSDLFKHPHEQLGK